MFPASIPRPTAPKSRPAAASGTRRRPCSPSPPPARAGGGCIPKEATNMPPIGEEDLQMLHTLLDAEPEARARYNQLAGYKQEMCLRWIADAPEPRLREQRILRLVRRLWLTAFDPYYDLVPMTLSELDAHYGPPRQL